MNRFARCSLAVLLVSIGLGCGGAASTATPASSPAGALPPSADGPVLSTSPPPGPDGPRALEAVKLTDEKRFDEAIQVFEEIRQRHPDSGGVLHELALAYRLSGKPKKAIEVLAPFRARLPAQTIAGLASAYDEAGAPADAQSVLREAIARYPRSALLLSELGVSLANGGKKEEGLAMFERAADVDPTFAPAYLHLAELLAQTRARGMALVYGETFRLLEPSSPRSEATAGLMVRVCKDAVKIEKNGAKTEAHISLAPDITISRPEQAASLPFVNVFELTFGPPLVKAHERGLTLASLHEARKSWLANMKKPGSPYDWNKVALVRWLRELDAAGHLEAYDVWLLGPAFPDERASWGGPNGAQRMEAMARFVQSHRFVPEGR